MAQQTAVEWLLDRVEDVDNTPEIWNKIKEKAKEMEKQQIVTAWDTRTSLIVPIPKSINGEQYYNETYREGKCNWQHQRIADDDLADRVQTEYLNDQK